MSILMIIDDYADICDSLKAILENDGHKVYTASSGEEGLKLFDNIKPDLVISDLVMPEMNGIEVLKRIKFVSPETDVILMTGHATVQTAVEGLKAGAVDYILKPVNFDALRHDIARALERRGLSEKLKLQQAKMVQLAKLTAVGQLGAGVAHEMNQPLMAMSAYLESLLMDDTIRKNPEVQARILKIKDQFTRLGTIVKRMHEYAGARTGGFVLEDPMRPVHDGYFILRQQLKNHNIIVRERIAEKLPKVFMDRYQIQDIVINFLINANDAVEERFNRAEGGEITLLTDRLKNVEAVLIGVIDNGIPVKKGTDQDIFNPFFTTKQPGKGTGLGLSVSHGIAQNHRGLISFAPLPGDRKIFYIVLPINKDQTLQTEDAVLAADIKAFLHLF